MKIKALKIRNFKQFVTADFSFDTGGKGIISIYGSPGSGKTALFEAIQWGISRYSGRLFDIDKIVNAEELSKAVINSVLTVLVEIKLEYRGLEFKCEKVLEVGKSPLGKPMSKKSHFTIFQLVDGNWHITEKDSLFPEVYLDVMFFRVEEWRKLGSYNYIIKGLSNNINVIEKSINICHSLKRAIWNRMPSGDEEEHKLQVLALEEEVDSTIGKLSYINENLCIVQGEFDIYKEILKQPENFSESLLPKDLKNKYNDVRNRVNQLHEEKKRYELHLKKCKKEYEKHQHALSLWEDKTTYKYRTLLVYVEEIQKWLSDWNEERQKSVVDEVSDIFYDEIRRFAYFREKGYSMQILERTEELSAWQKVTVWLVFLITCREYLYTDELLKEESIPLIIDDNFSAFDKQTLDSIIDYLGNRKEQVIIMHSDMNIVDSNSLGLALNVNTIV